MKVLLVALNGYRHRTVFQFMRFVPGHEGFKSEAKWASTLPPSPRSTLAVNQDGLHGMDFMGLLPKSKGYDYLLVVIDRLMLQVHLVPMDTRITSKEVTWLFLKEVVRLHRVPDSIVSNRDTKFTASFWKELHQLLGTKLLMSTTFHPQMDGATECANHSIAQVLQTLVCNDQKNWADMCLAIEFMLNRNVSATTGYAPFELNYGYIPQLGKASVLTLSSLVSNSMHNKHCGTSR